MPCHDKRMTKLHSYIVFQITLLSSAFSPIDNCPERGSVFTPYEPIILPGEDTPDRYSLGDWENRFDDLVQVYYMYVVIF